MKKNVLNMEVFMAETKLAIEEMSCQHCVMAVRKALGGVPGITESNIRVGSAAVKHDESKVKKADIELTIEKAGHMARRIS